MEELKLLTIASYASKSTFFKPLSWRTNFGWNKEYLDNSTHFTASVGAGQTWSNHFGYSYAMVEPIIYSDSKPIVGLGGSLGAVLYEGKEFKTNIELTQRYYDNKENQLLSKITQSWQIERNWALQLKYEFTEKSEKDTNSLKLVLNYFF